MKTPLGCGSATFAAKNEFAVGNVHILQSSSDWWCFSLTPSNIRCVRSCLWKYQESIQRLTCHAAESIARWMVRPVNRSLLRNASSKCQQAAALQQIAFPRLDNFKGVLKLANVAGASAYSNSNTDSDAKS